MQSPERYEHILKDPVVNEREKKVWAQYLKVLDKTIKDKLKNCPHKILSEWPRHRVFLGHYFYYVNFKSAKDAERFGKLLKGYADVYTLEEHSQLMLEVYNREIVKMNDFI
jgi:hypothetical protein